MDQNIISAQAISEKLRDKVRNTIFEEIPDEKWDQLIKAEIAAFFEPKVINHGHWCDKRPSKFGEIVIDEMTKIMREKLLQLFASDEWKVSYDGMVGEKLAEVVRKEAPNIIAAWVGQMVSCAIQSGRFG